MPVKEVGAISELRYLYNAAPKDNVIRGIRAREEYRSKVEAKLKEMNKEDMER